MKVIAFDFWDKERSNGVEIEPSKLGIKNLKKNEMFIIEDVTYMISKVFTKKSIKRKCIETKMLKYKIKDTVTTHVHKCPAKKGFMQKMTPESLKIMEDKFGKKTIKGWKEEGRVKMKTGLITQCPDCKCVFYKDKHVLPETIEVVSLKGKKKLKKRS